MNKRVYKQIDDNQERATQRVIFCIAPDGTLSYAWDADSASKAAQLWRDSLTDDQRTLHDENRTMGGFIEVTMLNADFNKLNMSPLP